MRLAAAAALVAVWMVGSPGIAAAAGTVNPLLDCVVHNANGTYTAVMGYANDTGRAQSIPYGSSNVIWPWKYDGAQPTTFYNGTYHGVFKVTVTAFDLWFYPNWQLNGSTVDYTDVTGNPCPAPTELPAVGNGTGVAIGLLVAGLVGVLLIRRYVRRAGVHPRKA